MDDANAVMMIDDEMKWYSALTWIGQRPETDHEV